MGFIRLTGLRGLLVSTGLLWLIGLIGVLGHRADRSYRVYKAYSVDRADGVDRVWGFRFRLWHSFGAGSFAVLCWVVWDAHERKSQQS